jgi:hypothetical protein
MTARRRRKSGSGPSATALIAWVGGAPSEIGAPTGAAVSVIYGRPSGQIPSAGQIPSGRAVLVGRACGLAAGTLLACGSVLAGATHTGDGAPLFNHIPAVPGAGSGAPDAYRGQAPVERASAAPDLVRAQAAADTSSGLHPRLGQVRRNTPASLDVPAEPNRQSQATPPPWDSSPPATGHAPTGPIAPVSPVLDPAAQGVGRVAPVGGVLAPTSPPAGRVGSSRDEQTSGPRDERATSPRDERTSRSTIEAVTQVVAPVDKAIQPVAQPAMAMLTSLLPIG